LWRELARLRQVALALALALVALLFALRATQFEPLWLLRALRAFYLWTALVAILGLAHRHLNRPWPWLYWANASVYPWYILHQTLIIVAVVALAPLQLGPVLEPMLLVALTVLGCWVLTDGLIRRVAWVRPLFGLKR
jgi:peptidoglycan/LPS O-acetylase OafA/YrhL